MEYLNDPYSKIINDKVGISTDIWSVDKTVLGFNNVIYQHIHKPAKYYPSLADGIVVVSGTNVWELGDFVELIPANEINVAFDIHWINFEGASSTDTYELVLYSGESGNEVEIGRVRTHREAAQSGTTNTPIQIIPPQSANTKISAKLASAAGNDSVTISLFYHEYGN